MKPKPKQFVTAPAQLGCATAADTQGLWILVNLFVFVGKMRCQNERLTSSLLTTFFPPTNKTREKYFLTK